MAFQIYFQQLQRYLPTRKGCDVMCELQSVTQDYQTQLISKLWKVIYILTVLCVLLVVLFTGLAIWGIKYFQSFEYVEETKYSYELDGVDVANINQQGGEFSGFSEGDGYKEEKEKEEKVNLIN